MCGEYHHGWPRGWDMDAVRASTFQLTPVKGTIGVAAMGQFMPTDEDKRRIAREMAEFKPTPEQKRETTRAMRGEYQPTPEELAAEAELKRFCDG